MPIFASKIVVSGKTASINKTERDDTVTRSAELKVSSYIRDTIKAVISTAGDKNATLEDDRSS